MTQSTWKLIIKTHASADMYNIYLIPASLSGICVFNNFYLSQTQSGCVKIITACTSLYILLITVIIPFTFVNVTEHDYYIDN